jgi:uncharacterized protein YycO
MGRTNHRYDGLYVFVLNLAKLQRGDVILTRNAESSSLKEKAVSYAITVGSRGSFSHALMCTTRPTLIEAIKDGVSNINAQRCFVHELNNIRVLRYPDAAIAGAAANAAMMFFSMGYSVRAAIASVVPAAKSYRKHDDRTFCSALVAAAFRTAKAPEFLFLDPMRTTPATLQKLAQFVDVTSDVCKRVLSPCNIEEMSALDGDRTPSLMGGQSKLMNSYYLQISVPIDQLMARHQTLTEHRPNSFFECLKFVSSLCMAASWLPDSDETAEIRKMAERIDALGFALLREGKLEAMEAATEAHDNEIIRYTLEESYKEDPDIDLEDTQSLIRASREQIQSRLSILNDPDRPPGVSLFWDEWTRMTRGSVTYFENRITKLSEALERAFPDAPAA